MSLIGTNMELLLNTYTKSRYWLSQLFRSDPEIGDPAGFFKKSSYYRKFTLVIQLKAKWNHKPIVIKITPRKREYMPLNGISLS